MAATVTIPPTTLTVGLHTFIGTVVASTDTQATINIDPTVAGGLNATPAAVIDVAIRYSTDGGTTWRDWGAVSGIQGPIIDHRTGNPASVWSMSPGVPPLPAQIRAEVTVHNASVVVAGSVVLA